MIALILVLLGNITQFVMLLLTMRIATSYLQPEEMGRLSLITAVTAFYVLFFVNPVGMFVNRRLHAWDAKGQAKKYLKLHWIYLLAVSGFAASSIYTLDFLRGIGGEFTTSWLIILVCGSIFFNTINQTVIPSLNMLGFRTLYFCLTLATVGLSLLCAFLFVTAYKPVAEYWQMGLIFGQMVLAIIGVIQLFSKLSEEIYKERIVSSQLKTIYSFAWPVALSVTLYWIQAQGYRFLAADVIGLNMLGLFVAGYGISAGLIAAFESIMVTYFQPKFYESVSNSCDSEQMDAWNIYAGAILPALVLVIFGLSALAPEITRIILGKQYHIAEEFVIWGVLSEGARVAAGVYGLSAHAKMRTRLLIIPNFTAASACILLIILLAPSYGTHGLGMARSITGLFLIIQMHYIAIKFFAIKFPYIKMLKAAIMGCLMYMVIYISRLNPSAQGGMIHDFIYVIVSGVFILPMLYWLLIDSIAPD